MKKLIILLIVVIITPLMAELKYNVKDREQQLQNEDFNFKIMSIQKRLKELGFQIGDLDNKDLSITAYDVISYPRGNLHRNNVQENLYELDRLITAGSGVTGITAGTNITISPTTGVGNVTINSSGGTGGMWITNSDNNLTPLPMGITVPDSMWQLVNSNLTPK